MWCIGLLITYCHVAQPAPSSGAAFCQVYRPTYWSASDTRKTKEQIDTLNRQWKRLCKTKK